MTMEWGIAMAGSFGSHLLVSMSNTFWLWTWVASKRSMLCYGYSCQPRWPFTQSPNHGSKQAIYQNCQEDLKHIQQVDLTRQEQVSLITSADTWILSWGGESTFWHCSQLSIKMLKIMILLSIKDKTQSPSTKHMGSNAVKQHPDIPSCLSKLGCIVHKRNVSS